MKNKKRHTNHIKALIIAFVVSVCIVIVFPLLMIGVFFVEIDSDTMVEGVVYHTTDVNDLDLYGPILPVPIESFDCYYSLQNASIFSDEVVAPVTGTITLTDENYQTIIDKYDDWKEFTRQFPPLDIGLNEGMAQGMHEYACDDIKKLIETETYLFSEKFVLDEMMILFVSKKDNIIYFYYS